MDFWIRDKQLLRALVLQIILFWFVFLATIKSIYIFRLWYNAIPCILYVYFDDAIHGRCASYFVNIVLKSRVNVYKTQSISPMYRIIKINIQYAWDGIVP